MICVACSSSNEDGALFCTSCGAELGSPCPGCGARVAPNARFCGACGKAIADVAQPPVPVAVPVAGERRPATILFADVVGFSTLAEKLDPEDLRARMTEAFERIAGAIAAEEGWIEKYIGDAVMAVFGIPVAHEDDPARAVRAALAIRDTFHGTDLGIRIGVNTGLIVTSTAGDATVGVMGDAVNAAARLQQHADPGTVVVGERTWRSVRQAFVGRALGALKVKGKSEPVRAYAIEQALETREGVAAQAPLVGRDAELAMLAAAWAGTRAGTPHLISVTGDPGIGKSRLVEEFAGAIADEALVLKGECRPHGSVPYGPFRQILSAIVGAASDAGLDDAVRKYGLPPDASPLLGSLLGLREWQERGDESRRAYAAFTELLSAAAKQQPLFVVVEDVHWADASTWDLISFVTARLPRAPIALVLTHRPAFERVSELRVRATQTTIRLEPLGEAAARTLARAVAEGALPDAALSAIFARAEGNPFYVEEIIRSLVEEDVLRHVDGTWTLTRDLEEMRLPETVQAVILSRMDRLPPASKRTLQRASVLGRTFSCAMLRALAPEASLDEDLETLERADLVRFADILDETVEFKHALTQEVAYAGLLMRQREELHRVAVRCFTEQESTNIAALAYHSLQAGDVDAAIEYSIAAADRAEAAFANLDAAAHLRRAIDLLDAPGMETRRARLMVRAAKLLGSNLRRDEAATLLERAIALLRSTDDRGALAEALSQLGILRYFSHGDYPLAASLVAEAVSLLEKLGDTPDLATVIHDAALLAMIQGNDEPAIRDASRALELAQRLGMSELVTRSMNTYGTSMGGSGRLTQGTELLRASIERARQANDPANVGRGFMNLLHVVAFVGGDVQQGLVIGAEAYAFTRSLSGDQFGYNIPLNYAAVLQMASRYAESLAIVEEMPDLLEDSSWLTAFREETLARGLRMLGDVAGAREHAVRALETVRGTMEPQQVIPILHELAACATASGDRAAAIGWIDEATLLVEGHPTTRYIEAEELFGIGLLLCELGDMERAVRWRGWLEEGAARDPSPWRTAWAAVMRAEHLAAAGDRVAADAAFAEADAKLAESHRPAQHARVLRRWAETCAPPQTRSIVLHRARVLAESCGAALELASIDAALSAPE